jgi:lipopolysaccharide transport system ATP-binding protein
MRCFVAGSGNLPRSSNCWEDLVDSPQYASRLQRSDLDRRNIAIEVRNVSKRFYIYEHRSSSLRERFVRTLTETGSSIEKQTYFSLQDVSLSIEAGETWTLIGANGAGKSTLLRMIAGIYWPTSGVVITRGRVAALIELSAGFHHELTGAENIYLYGSILGFSKNEISRRYEEIVEFAGIGEFITTPVKYYSTGMEMRLAFAVATAVEPDILLLDEIFAVGDAEFRERCIDRIRVFQIRGCTLVLATHDLELAEAFATKALWLDHGRMRMRDEAGRVIGAYRASFAK